MGSEIAVVQQAKPVLGPHRSIGGAQTRQPRERRLEIFGFVAEMHARATLLLLSPRNGEGRRARRTSRGGVIAPPAGLRPATSPEGEVETSVLPHRVRFSQCEANTIADSTKPRMTLTTTPELNASNGLVPACANSRTRAVRPMLKKQKMKAHVRRSLIGPTSAGFTILLKSARLYRLLAQGKINDAV